MIDIGFQPDGRKVFFDISSILTYVEHNDRYSGIQRVVAEMVTELAGLMGVENLYLSWCERSKPGTVAVPLSEVGVETLLVPSEMRKLFFPHATVNFRPRPLAKYRSGSAKYYFHRTRLDLASLRGKDSSFRRFDMTAKSWAEARRSSKPAQSLTKAPQGLPLETLVSQGDHLVLLDSSWEQFHTKSFAAAKGLGMEVHTLVYDLIPILVPHVNMADMMTMFYDWLLQSAEYTTRYMTISEATKRDLEQFFENHDIDRPVFPVPLSQCGLTHRAPDARAERLEGPVTSRVAFDKYPHLADSFLADESVRTLIGSPYALCVGTIEPRKNVWRLAMAWKYLLDQGHVDIPKLVLAGRPGWLKDDFDMLRAYTGSLYSYLHVIEGPSDETLEILYRNADFTLMPSIYEGWGLPVGEALAYGKTAVVGDNSSLVEVGQDLVEYCDASSIKSIAEAVLRLTSPERRRELEQKIADTTLRTWTDVARDMGRAIFAHE